MIRKIRVSFFKFHLSNLQTDRMALVRMRMMTKMMIMMMIMMILLVMAIIMIRDALKKELRDYLGIFPK